MYHYKHTANGMVLLTILLFMEIFALMAFCNLTMVSNMLKLNRQLWERDIHLITANQILSLVEESVMKVLPDCVISIESPERLAKKTLSWWQQHACSGNFNEIRYYYAIEKVDQDPCVLVKKYDHNQPIIIDYYRITLYLEQGKATDLKIMLQSTLAKASGKNLTCLGNFHWVSLGRQMQREIL